MSSSCVAKHRFASVLTLYPTSWAYFKSVRYGADLCRSRPVRVYILFVEWGQWGEQGGAEDGHRAHGALAYHRQEWALDQGGDGQHPLPHPLPRLQPHQHRGEEQPGLRLRHPPQRRGGTQHSQGQSVCILSFIYFIIVHLQMIEGDYIYSSMKVILQKPTFNHSEGIDTWQLSFNKKFFSGQIVSVDHWSHTVVNSISYLFIVSRRFRRKSRLLQWLVFFRQFNAIGPLFVH